MDQLSEIIQKNIEVLSDCECGEYNYIPQKKGQSLLRYTDIGGNVWLTNSVPPYSRLLQQKASSNVIE